MISEKFKMFCSYAHEDQPFISKLKTHLASLQRKGLLYVWHDADISPGMEWEEEIYNHLNAAHVILLLISPDFIASEYCYSKEMKRAMERHEQGEALVIPVLLRSCDWQGLSFSKLQVLPSNAHPVAAWQSIDEAFLDITQGIERAVQRWHVKPTTSSLQVRQTKSVSFPEPFPPFWNVPYRHNPFFISREHILERLHQDFQMLRPEASIPIQALTGLGGVGKTQTATEYAFRYRVDYRKAVFWVRAASEESLISDFLALAGPDLLNLPVQDAPDQNHTIRGVKRWLRDNADWLLIFDNADDLTLATRFLPSAGRGHILLTTRSLAIGDLSQGVEVEPLKLEEGALFLLRRAKIVSLDRQFDSIADEDRRKAITIAKHMQGLPLALDQTGAYIEETHCALQGYLNVYATHRPHLMKDRGGPAPEYIHPVATTWTVAKEYLQKKKPAAAELLKLCAFLYPDAIPEEIFLEGASDLGPLLRRVATDQFMWNDTLKDLLRFSLIHRDGEARTLTIHHLVQDVLKDEMDASTQCIWADRAVHAVNRTFPQRECANWQACQKYLPQAQVCKTLIEQYQICFKGAAQLLHRAGRYLYERAHYSQAASFYQQALSVYQQSITLGGLDLITAQQEYTDLQQKLKQ
jgi:hypothetical protein